MMNNASLKENVQRAVFAAVDRLPYVVSATITGSFVDSQSLEGLSDIDVVVILDHVNRPRFEETQASLDHALRPVLARHGYDLRLNPTLGPLKYNEPGLAVLHVMMYSCDTHVDHVINSPFTCLDWQRSGVVRKKRLSEIYPVYGLQPRHFLGARRSAMDYLTDLDNGVISYRELNCDAEGYTEVRRTQPMGVRERHEFAYHVMRFLMRNLLKLVRRTNDVPAQADDLLNSYFEVFPREREGMAELFLSLAAKKRAHDYASDIPNLTAHMYRFVQAFERQFREEFVEGAGSHLVFRHAPTAANVGEREFLGRSDIPIRDDCFDAAELAAEVETANPAVVWCSPLRRCRQTVERFIGREDLEIVEDDRLVEFDYGECERLTVSQARKRFPGLFQAWGRQEDPCFPGGGENTMAVVRRVSSFMRERLADAGQDSLVCTHNGVIRVIVGMTLGIPQEQWHHIDVPHCAPITVVRSRRFGLFLNIPPAVERRMFRWHKVKAA